MNSRDTQSDGILSENAHFTIPRSLCKFSRREFVAATLATGFALSVLPVSAETITTDSNGLVAGEVKIPVQGGEIPAYRAMPATGGPFPTILVAHEIFGVHEHIKDICRRLAKLGYFAVAPYLYARAGDVAARPTCKKFFPSCARCRRAKSPRTSTPRWRGPKTRARRIPRASVLPGLLGRTSGLAICRTQSRPESRRRVVRAITIFEIGQRAQQSG